MKAVEENAVRELLAQAVSPIDPVAPPFASVRQRAVRRRRTRRTAGGFMVVIATGAAVAIVASIVSATPGGNAELRAASAPTHASLVQFARAHGGHKLVAGPFTGSSGSYGVFARTKNIEVAAYGAGKWHQDGPDVSGLGNGSLVTHLGLGPKLNATTPSLWVGVIGGDVSYFGSVLYRGDHRWLIAHFGGCGHHGLCPTPSTSQPYGHPAKEIFTSVSNNCTPNCAAGIDYRVTWSWRVAKHRFSAAAEHALKR
jgi:hypothetical protein